MGMERLLLRTVFAKFTEDNPITNTPIHHYSKFRRRRDMYPMRPYGNTHQYYPVVAKEEYRKTIY